MLAQSCKIRPRGYIVSVLLGWRERGQDPSRVTSTTRPPQSNLIAVQAASWRFICQCPRLFVLLSADAPRVHRHGGRIRLRTFSRRSTALSDFVCDIRRSLELIEHVAQASLLDAARAICDVPGMADEYFATLELYDQVKAHWHRIDRKRWAVASKEAPGKHR